MDNIHNIADAGLYTDFSGLAKLRAEATGQSDAAAKEVAEQFESLFLQMMLKSMRDATVPGESAESDQTKFYQEMFDKQIALDLSNNGDGIGLAKMLEKQISGNKNMQSENTQIKGFTEVTDIALIRNQIERSTSSILNKSSGTIYHVSPEGVSIKDDTNSKSSGTIYHASPEGVSIRDDTNSKSSGTIYHVSPEGVSIRDDTSNEQSSGEE